MPRRFRPALGPTIAFLVLLPTLIALGVWQLDRAAESRALQTLYDARTEGPVVAIGEAIGSASELRYHRVTFAGYYDSAYTILLDNRVHKGMVGYDVVTPVRIDGTQTRVLVDRGWVPMGPSRSKLPDVTAPSGLQKITGIAKVPAQSALLLTGPSPAGDGWQTVWERLDMGRYAKEADFPIQPVVVLLDPDSPAGGYVRDWKPLNTRIAMHEGYAYQWFAMALILTGLYFYLNFRPVGDPSDGDEGGNGIVA